MAKVKRSNKEYLSFIEKNTKHIYMLSEFIDNSIQSARDHNLDSVEVSIKMDNKNERLTVSDNAGGISYINREAAISNGKEDNIKGNNLNMFGVGLKMAAIWFGRRLKYYTKAIDDDFTYSVELDIDNLEKNDWQTIDEKNIDISLSSGVEFNNISGTVIVIDKFHQEHDYRYKKIEFCSKSAVSKSANPNTLHDQISLRFNRQLKSGFLKVIISYIDESGEEKADQTNNSTTLLSSESVPNLAISKEDKDYEYETSSAVKSFLETQKMVKLFQKYEKKDYFNTSISVGEEFSLRDIVQLIKNQKPVWFKVQLKLISQGGVVVPFAFGFLSAKNKKSYLKYRGVSVYQDGRAIVSGPNTKDNSPSWLSMDKTLTTDSYKLNNRFFAELDLEDKSKFKVDNNKMSFNGNLQREISEDITRYLSENHLFEFFDDFLNALEEKEDIKKLDEENKKANEDFVKKTNELSIISDAKITTSEIKWSSNGEEEREIQVLKILNETNNEQFYLLTLPQNFGPSENKILFKKEVMLNQKDGLGVFKLLVNKRFYAFSKDIDDNKLIPLINPMRKLIIASLNNCKNDIERSEEFDKIMEILE